MKRPRLQVVECRVYSADITTRWYIKRIWIKRLFSFTGLFMDWQLQTACIKTNCCMIKPQKTYDKGSQKSRQQTNRSYTTTNKFISKINKNKNLKILALFIMSSVTFFPDEWLPNRSSDEDLLKPEKRGFEYFSNCFSRTTIDTKTLHSWRSTINYWVKLIVTKWQILGRCIINILNTGLEVLKYWNWNTASKLSASRGKNKEIMRNGHSNKDNSEFDNTTKKLDTVFWMKIIISNGIKKEQGKT